MQNTRQKEIRDLQAKEILQLKKWLQRGDQASIAEATGYSIYYVSRVLNPKDRALNDKIIDEAIKVAQRNKLRRESQSHTIKDLAA